jgi:hypothetical protein
MSSSHHKAYTKHTYSSSLSSPNLSVSHANWQNLSSKRGSHSLSSSLSPTLPHHHLSLSFSSQWPHRMTLNHFANGSSMMLARTRQFARRARYRRMGKTIHQGSMEEQSSIRTRDVSFPCLSGSQKHSWHKPKPVNRLVGACGATKRRLEGLGWTER